LEAVKSYHEIQYLGRKSSLKANCISYRLLGEQSKLSLSQAMRYYACFEAKRLSS
jgi:hypothetical protein